MTAAQTTASFVARLDATGPTVWATGTSSPCLSVFKPAPFDPVLFAPRPLAEASFDHEELWWAHERLHRACLDDYASRRVTFAEERERFQAECLAHRTDPSARWGEHRTYIDEWLDRASRAGKRRLPWMHRRYWWRQSKLADVPAT